MPGERTPLILSRAELESVAAALEAIASDYREAAKKLSPDRPEGIKVKAVKLLLRTKNNLLTCASAIQGAILAMKVDAPIWNRIADETGAISGVKVGRKATEAAKTRLRKTGTKPRDSENKKTP